MSEECLRNASCTCADCSAETLTAADLLEPVNVAPRRTSMSGTPTPGPPPGVDASIMDTEGGEPGSFKMWGRW